MVKTLNGNPIEVFGSFNTILGFIFLAFVLFRDINQKLNRILHICNKNAIIVFQVNITIIYVFLPMMNKRRYVAYVRGSLQE